MLSRKNARVNSSTCKLFMCHQEKWSFVCRRKRESGDACAQTHFASKQKKSCHPPGRTGDLLILIFHPTLVWQLFYGRIYREGISDARGRSADLSCTDWCNVLGRWRVSNMSKIYYPAVLLSLPVAANSPCHFIHQKALILLTPWSHQKIGETSITLMADGKAATLIVFCLSFCGVFLQLLFFWDGNYLLNKTLWLWKDFLL